MLTKFLPAQVYASTLTYIPSTGTRKRDVEPISKAGRYCNFGRTLTKLYFVCAGAFETLFARVCGYFYGTCTQSEMHRHEFSKISFAIDNYIHLPSIQEEPNCSHEACSFQSVGARSRYSWLRSQELPIYLKTR